MKKHISIAVLQLSLICVLFSCSEETLLVETLKPVEEEVDLTTLRATLKDFKNETMGEEPAVIRSTIVTDEAGELQIVWAENDTIGIFPSSGMQVAFPMASSAGTKNATFDGGGWGLKRSATYSAYYPLIGQFYLDRTNIPMIISNQKQDGNGSYSHFGKYDYMAAVNSAVNESGGIEFNFNHLVSILHMQIKMPKGGKYTYVALETSDKFTTEATINLTDGTVIPSKQSPIQIMQLEHVELDNSEENPILELWIVIHPVDLTGQILYTKVYDEDNNCYTTTMQAKNFEAGTIYNSRKIAVEDMTHTGLPVTIINTPNNQDITSKEEYVEDALMTILQTDISDEFCEIMNMKGRGNSTWAAPKKPYAIKFGKKKSILSLPEDKSWVLLANYYDATLLRNDLAFYMGNEMSTLDWTPHYQQIDLMLNGQYKGIYQLGEKVKIAKKRVNVGDDGFLLEVDAKAAPEEITFRVPNISQPINIKDPEVEVGGEDYNYIVDFMERADAALFSSDFLDEEEGYKKYIDEDSFVEWYLINEIAKNNDAIFYTSCYMNVKRGGKLKMGPLWDFDLGFGGYFDDERGRTIVNVPENFYIKSNVKWINRMFKDPVFVTKVKDRFNYYYANRQQIYDHIDANASTIIEKIYEDNKMWGRVCSKSSSKDEVKAAYQEKVNYLKNWIETRLNWLNENINAL